MEILVEYLAKGFMVMLMVSLPCVLVAAGIGLVVGILQAVTQVQEQTIAAAPKILLVFLTIVVLGMWYIKILTEFVIEGTAIAFNVVPKNDEFVLDSNYYKYTRSFTNEMYDKVDGSQKDLNEIMKNPGKLPWVDKAEKNLYGPTRRGANPTPNFIERNKIMGR